MYLMFVTWVAHRFQSIATLVRLHTDNALHLDKAKNHYYPDYLLAVGRKGCHAGHSRHRAGELVVHFVWQDNPVVVSKDTTLGADSEGQDQTLGGCRRCM